MPDNRILITLEIQKSMSDTVLKHSAVRYHPPEDRKHTMSIRFWKVYSSYLCSVLSSQHHVQNFWEVTAARAGSSENALTETL